MSFTLTEADINALHKEEFASAAADFGGSIFAIPHDIRFTLGQRTRERWVRWVEERDRGAGDDTPHRTHDKTRRIEEFLASKVGKHVTVQMMIDASDCSRGTAYKYVSDNRSRFVQIDTGVYRVVDTAAERAAAGRPTTRPTLPARTSDSGRPATDAAHVSDTVHDALRRATGGAQ